MILLLGATRALAKADLKLPSKWLAIFENVRISSDILHLKLSSLDKEMGEEFVEKEEIMAKRLGKQKFYSIEEIEELKDQRDEVDIQIPRF